MYCEKKTKHTHTQTVARAWSLRPLCEEVPLLPKLRGYFAEFLRERCLTPLGILYLPTYVDFGYKYPFVEGCFPRSMAWITSALQRCNVSYSNFGLRHTHTHVAHTHTRGTHAHTHTHTRGTHTHTTHAHMHAHMHAHTW